MGVDVHASVDMDMHEGAVWMRVGLRELFRHGMSISVQGVGPVLHWHRLVKVFAREEWDIEEIGRESGCSTVQAACFRTGICMRNRGVSVRVPPVLVLLFVLVFRVGLVWILVPLEVLLLLEALRPLEAVLLPRLQCLYLRVHLPPPTPVSTPQPAKMLTRNKPSVLTVKARSSHPRIRTISPAARRASAVAQRGPRSATSHLPMRLTEQLTRGRIAPRETLLYSRTCETTNAPTRPQSRPRSLLDQQLRETTAHPPLPISKPGSLLRHGPRGQD